MQDSIVKCELLWSRRCMLRCTYCGMQAQRDNAVPLELWFQGVDNLVKLGCKFMAIYGAEPLAVRPLDLARLIGYAEGEGIACTVITSACVPELTGKLDVLHEHGLRSLTVSDDLSIHAKHGNSGAKTMAGLRARSYFQGLGGYRDVGATVTLTRKNFRMLPDAVRRLTSEDTWIFWDLIHASRGQPGTKCALRCEVSDFLFREEDLDELADVLDEVTALKQGGFKVHQSERFLQELCRNDWALLKNYNWHCAREQVFPAWVTVDCDGAVFPCDDFQPRAVSSLSETYVFQLCDEWEKWKNRWKSKTQRLCPGCAWNTHMDATWIKSGAYDIGEYVHGLNREETNTRRRNENGNHGM